MARGNFDNFRNLDNLDNLKKHWSRNAVVYQIYPLSFKDSNGDGRGDLAGIIDKLDYLQKLGVNAIWICPFFRSPMADFGYDVEDYKDVDPVFGDLKIFERLIFEAKKRKMRVLVDFVGNHTSATHKWFVESRSSRENPKRDWYIWHDGTPHDQTQNTLLQTPPDPPNNWISVFGGSAWQFDKATGQYYLHTFLKEQPDLNWHNSEVRTAMMDVIDFWVEQGVDGFRVDALQHFLEDEKLRDEKQNPTFQKETDEPYKALVHRFSLSGELGGSNSSNKRANIIGSFLNEALEKHPDLFIVGEVYVGLKQLTKVYDLCPNGRFMPFNFNLIGVPWMTSEYKKIIDEYQSKLKPHHLPNYVLGNHDVARLASRLGEAKARLVAFWEFTLPGMPFIYYGDEIGMINGTIPENAIRDVLAKMFPGLHPGRDMERTPMQWNDSAHAGFTDGSKPWLPIAENFEKINVESEERNEHSTLSLYKNLIRLRQSSDALRLGDYTPRHSNSPSVFSFERHFGNERLLILVNFGQNIEREILPTHAANHGQDGDIRAKIIFSTHRLEPTYQNIKTVELMPHEACVVRV